MIGYKTSMLGRICLLSTCLLACTDGQLYRNPWIRGMNSDHSVMRVALNTFREESSTNLFDHKVTADRQEQ